MKTRFLIHTILLAVAATSASAADLGAVYQRALANDPVIREAEANRRAARESKPQALAALLPQVNASGRYDEEETDSTGAFVQPGLPPTPAPPPARPAPAPPPPPRRPPLAGAAGAGTSSWNSTVCQAKNTPR